MGSKIENRVERIRKESKQVLGPVSQRMTVGSLPDNVLLEMFRFYRVTTTYEGVNAWNWNKLVHVCRRWRDVIFASPLALDLQLLCTRYTPVKASLDIWPALPLIIDVDDLRVSPRGASRALEDGLDDLVVALKYRDRIRQIRIRNLSSSQFERIAKMMREPFPSLTSISFGRYEGEAVVFLDQFLNGSAPRLQHLDLWRIAIPSLPKLLLSATDLTTLCLCDIPNISYIPPETMVTCLSVLIKLECLAIEFHEFQTWTPHPNQSDRHSSHKTRTVLPALTELSFQGVSEYLEVLGAQIDAPLLEEFRTCYLNQLVFDIPQTVRFICHRGVPRPDNLCLVFCPMSKAIIQFSNYEKAVRTDLANYLEWIIQCKRLDGQVLSAVDICRQNLPICSSVERLYIRYGDWSHGYVPLGNQLDDLDPVIWIGLFRSFISVKMVELSIKLAPFVAAALQGLTDESATEVFPALQSISIVGNTSDIEKSAQQGIDSFVTARKRSGRPVAVRVKHKPYYW